MSTHAPYSWLYNLHQLRHVAFDEGFGRRLVHHITRATPGLVTEAGAVTLGDIGAGVGQLGGWLRDQGVRLCIIIAITIIILMVLWLGMG